MNNNPDVLNFSQVTAANLDVKDYRRELKQKDEEGKEKSYNPPRFEYEYDFYMVIRVNHPWFDEMRFKLNQNKLVIQELAVVRSSRFSTQTSFNPSMSYEYQNYTNMAKEIKEILLGRSSACPVQTQEYVAANNTMDFGAPGVFGPWRCVCGAENTGKFCEYCGSPKP